MDTMTWVQILDKTACKSYIPKSLGKGMTPTILSPAMGKIVGQIRFSHFGMATGLWEKKNSEFKPVKLHLNIYLVLQPALVEGLGIYIYIYIYIHMCVHVCVCMCVCVRFRVLWMV